ncbi:putative outer membrane starch-binding protein [Sediminitomix flava]|uniref:Putative outer membrane starch-binding protein n=2 Tax=Sediminitomix flava TaxID=379075 RepID=A0A315ZLG3_SEDFL|nr:putative outer membrane starch-binding protein [Sediminitomix flava]
MKKYIRNLTIGVGLLAFTGACNDFLEPEPENTLTEEQILRDPALAEGLLLNAYTGLPSTYKDLTDYGTDDLVINQVGHNTTAMAVGGWNASDNPQGKWESYYKQIFYINYFLERLENVTWSYLSEDENTLYLKRLEGEAKGLRAWYHFELLKRHGGMGVNGELLGVPYVTKAYGVNDEFQLARPSYDETVTSIVSDLTDAQVLLTPEYADIDPVTSVTSILNKEKDAYEGEKGAAMYDKAQELSDAGASLEDDETLAQLVDDYNAYVRVYNVVYGARNQHRLTDIGVDALMSRVTLHVASPLFNTTNDQTKWTKAAQEAGILILKNGGLDAISSTGHRFYQDKDDSEVLWRHELPNPANTIEQFHYPPSLAGSGRSNPTQNLVDAFPMSNGYPITDVRSGYDPQDPYSGRDPRLTDYVVYNGNNLGSRTIYTNLGEEDAKGAIINASSITGYYMKKLLNDNLDFTGINDEKGEYFYALFRYTEVLLNFAEAANEVGGPDAMIDIPNKNGEKFSFTPREIIERIRNRAGVSNAYLSELDQDGFRALIRNERRIELAFEGFRFWDLRRWDQDLNETVRGINVTGSFGNYTYTIDPEVQIRDYASYMKYGPIPLSETQKYPIIQNQGW